MYDMRSNTSVFNIVEHAGAVSNRLSAGARLGRLSFEGRRTIDTPHYVAITSRGVIPHVTPDVLAQHTGVKAAYVALEDCELPEPD